MTGITGQVIEASWRDAWLHEARDSHGRWTRGGLAPVRLSRQELFSRLTEAWQETPLIEVQEAVDHAADAWDAGHPALAVGPLLQAAMKAEEQGFPEAGTKLRGIASDILDEIKKARDAGIPLAPGVSAHKWPSTESKAAAQAEVDHALDIQRKYVPKIVASEKVTLADIDDANGETLDRHQVVIDPANTEEVGNTDRKWNDFTPHELQEDEQKRGFWVPSDPQYSLTDTTIAHETGHVVSRTLPHLFSRELWDTLAGAAGLMPPYSPPSARNKTTVSPANLSDWAMKNNYALSKYVSEYGTTSMEELFAEMWSEYTMSSSPRPMAKAYGDWVMNRLRETGKL